MSDCRKGPAQRRGLGIAAGWWTLWVGMRRRIGIGLVSSVLVATATVGADRPNVIVIEERDLADQRPGRTATMRRALEQWKRDVANGSTRQPTSREELGGSAQ